MDKNINLCNGQYNFYSNIRKNPWEVLLHKPILDLMRLQRVLATHIFIAVKQTIAMACKMPRLSFEELIQGGAGCWSMKSSRQYSDTQDKFLYVWQPWLDPFPSMCPPVRFLIQRISIVFSCFCHEFPGRGWPPLPPPCFFFLS